MRPGAGRDRNPGLRADALGFAESVIMGSGPAYSVAASTATLVGVVGVLAPASVLYCGLIMFGIVFAFRHLNRVAVNAGASYAWVAAIFSPALRFFAGWALIISSAVFMVSGKHPSRRLADPKAGGARFRRQSGRGHPGGRRLARGDRRRRRQRDQAQQLYAGRVQRCRGCRMEAPYITGVAAC
jgi:hypothetical protein